jgi:7-keto-8-aminopelargonate synthetase-like enzyme
MTFAHNDPDALAARLAGVAPGKSVLVVVDGVYSMSGQACRLDQIVEVCARANAQLLVDDAHGVGVLGGGRGTCEQFGATGRVDLLTVTFSKALASLGGAVLGDEQVIHYLRHHARTEIFSAGITPGNAAAALAALRIARAEPWRGQSAMENARVASRELEALGLHVGSSDSPIVSVHTSDMASALVAWRRLLDLGVYTNAVVPPAASPRLRTSYMATHEAAHLERLVTAFATVVGEGLLLEGDRAA